MPDPRQYQSIAARYQIAAKELNGTVHEVSAFTAYHAFESIGAAWLRHVGRKVPVRHHSKLREFSVRSRRLRAHKAIGQVALLLHAIRNKLLYPSLTSDGTYEEPRNILTPADSERIVKRVGGIVRAVSREL